MKKKPIQKNEPTLAPGLEDEKILEIEATPQEISEGNYTMVTKLSYDEVEPSAKD